MTNDVNFSREYTKGILKLLDKDRSSENKCTEKSKTLLFFKGIISDIVKYSYLREAYLKRFVVYIGL